MAAESNNNRIVRVGIIGCGEIAQVGHIPNLCFMSDYFRITYLCDVSPGAVSHSAQKIINHVPQITLNPEELCSSNEVDLVMVINSDEYHADHAILALQNDKHVFIEKPMALCERDADAIIEAEKKSKGAVMVGYMRRYAAAFTDALKEIGGLDKITYARVRDIIGPNSEFVKQSGTFPKQFQDFSEDAVREKQSKAMDIVQQGLEKDCGVSVTDQLTRMWRLLGGLGSHDLSAMREALGMPLSVIGASLGPPFWSAMFQYPHFTVTYESGVDRIPRFDAHIEVYSMDKSVRVQIDSPYVKGLPTTLHISENLGNGCYKESTVRRTYEDPYTLEMKELYQWVVNGKPVKTTAVDAKQDLTIFQMIIKAAIKR